MKENADPFQCLHIDILYSRILNINHYNTTRTGFDLFIRLIICNSRKALVLHKISEFWIFLHTLWKSPLFMLFCGNRFMEILLVSNVYSVVLEEPEYQSKREQCFCHCCQLFLIFRIPYFSKQRCLLGDPYPQFKSLSF